MGAEKPLVALLALVPASKMAAQLFGISLVDEMSLFVANPKHDIQTQSHQLL
jgi:hypothetical protein